MTTLVNCISSSSCIGKSSTEPNSNWNINVNSPEARRALRNQLFASWKVSTGMPQVMWNRKDWIYNFCSWILVPNQPTDRLHGTECSAVYIRSAGQEIPWFYESVLTQSNPVNVFTPYFSKIRFNIILQSTPMSPKWSVSLRFSRELAVCRNGVQEKAAPQQEVTVTCSWQGNSSLDSEKCDADLFHFAYLTGLDVEEVSRWKA
jgi:hypothetical protein